eukprot:TRINITY_DN11788_c0_g1_i23.p4 TRINITY_DN11788_c0_g1~~TRINITY_DN11788_c0_g1_i23.p4  ORF type:complete len:104 (-),score=12.03 TRINITY_DN11788_c0_g1_i23:250-561(-)
MQMLKELRFEKGLSNNRSWRNISDKLDDFMNWHGERQIQSSLRGVLHGSYHTAIAAGKSTVGNFTGAKKEIQRAVVQFKKMRNVGRSPPRSNVYEKGISTQTC